MKYLTLTLFLFATLAHADIQIRQLTSEQTDQGYIFQFAQDGVSYCWAMPQMLDQSFIPATWTPVTQAAIDYSWPVMTGDASLACLSAPILRTVRSPFVVMDTGYNPRLVPRGVPAGIPCGDAIGNDMFVVTYAGQIGFAHCE